MACELLVRCSFPCVRIERGSRPCERPVWTKNVRSLQSSLGLHPCPPEKPQGRLILERPFSVVAGPRLRVSPASNG